MSGCSGRRGASAVLVPALAPSVAAREDELLRSARGRSAHARRGLVEGRRRLRPQEQRRHRRPLHRRHAQGALPPRGDPPRRRRDARAPCRASSRRCAVASPSPRACAGARRTPPSGRPVQWLAALDGDTVVPFEFAGVTSGRETRGHRFLAPAAITLAQRRRLREPSSAWRPCASTPTPVASRCSPGSKPQPPRSAASWCATPSSNARCSASWKSLTSSKVASKRSFSSSPTRSSRA